MRLLRWASAAVVLAALLAMLGLFGLRSWADHKYNKYRGQAQVLALPDGLPDRSPRPAFSGPHPRLVERPLETFAFPIALGDVGPVDPLFAAPNQYPFLCQTVESDYGQPAVDNQNGVGMAVYRENADGSLGDEIVGYSRDCSLATHIRYYYLSATDDQFHPYSGPHDDIATVQRNGREIPFVVRAEIGTINRYIYVLAVLAGPKDRPETPDLSHWNERMIYLFRGGVGIGRRQASASMAAVFKRTRDQIAAGYAIAHSSGNRTTNTYDPGKSEDTLLRVRRQFDTRYGEPRFVIGMGGSGGAIAQYLIGQNNPEALDAAIAQYSYPDMITQSIPIVDCDFLEHYFEVHDYDNPTWQSMDARRAVEGLNTTSAFTNPIYRVLGLQRLLRGEWRWTRGATECVESWRGMSALVMNPTFSHNSVRYAPDVAKATHWTYWEDLNHVFGVDQNGYARETWDNVGVQYGLQALRDGTISADEFLSLNATIGGWPPPAKRLPERYAVMDAAPSRFADFQAFSGHNMRLGSLASPARRQQADPDAVRAAFLSGQVFAGRIDIPVVDVRHYLEPELDMHHANASFSARLRMQAEMGHADNQIIWVTEKPHMPVPEALDVLDRWLIASERTGDVIAARPTDALDRCWQGDGTLIAEGAAVWDGVWNERGDGACMRAYPIFANSRVVAGDSYRGDVFKCALQSVDDALANGSYAPVDMSAHRDDLRRIFPQGVCDFTQPDPLRPASIFEGSMTDSGRESRE